MASPMASLMGHDANATQQSRAPALNFVPGAATAPRPSLARAAPGRPSGSLFERLAHSFRLGVAAGGAGSTSPPTFHDIAPPRAAGAARVAPVAPHCLRERRVLPRGLRLAAVVRVPPPRHRPGDACINFVALAAGAQGEGARAGQERCQERRGASEAEAHASARSRLPCGASGSDAPWVPRLTQRSGDGKASRRNPNARTAYDDENRVLYVQGRTLSRRLRVRRVCAFASSALARPLRLGYPEAGCVCFELNAECVSGQERHTLTVLSLLPVIMKSPS